MSHGEFVKVAAYQGPLIDADIPEAVDLVRERVRECEAQEFGVLCCPEGFLGGLADYNDDPFRYAIRSDEVAAVLAPIVSETVTTIVGLAELSPDGKLYNAAAVFQRGKVLGLYRKLHPAIRRSVYEAGSATPVFQASDLTFGILICNDSTYPELAKAIVARGAIALFIPTNNGLPKHRNSTMLNNSATMCDTAIGERGEGSWTPNVPGTWARPSQGHFQVSLRREKVSQGLNPTPLKGVSPFVPFLSPTPQVPASGERGFQKLDLAVDQVRSALGITNRRRARLVRNAIQLAAEKGDLPATIALDMIAAVREQDRLHLRRQLKFKYGLQKFLGEGIWRDRNRWAWDPAEMRLQAEARLGN